MACSRSSAGGDDTNPRPRRTVQSARVAHAWLRQAHHAAERDPATFAALTHELGQLG
jgi:hypothetical protein